jgi:hypothetical protein
LALAAEQHAERARQVSQPGYEIVLRETAARAYLLAERHGDALASASLAYDRLIEVGGVEENEADVFSTYARTLRSNGQAIDAQRVIEEGGDRVRALASKIRDVALRRQFIEQVPAHRHLLSGIV